VTVTCIGSGIIAVVAASILVNTTGTPKIVHSAECRQMLAWGVSCPVLTAALIWFYFVVTTNTACVCSRVTTTDLFTFNGNTPVLCIRSNNPAYDTCM